jgi:hypothetical protein
MSARGDRDLPGLSRLGRFRHFRGVTHDVESVGDGIIRALDVADQVEWRDESGPLRPSVEGGQSYSGRLVFWGVLRSLVLLRAVAFPRFVPGFCTVGRWLVCEGRPQAVIAPARSRTIAIRWFGRRGRP